MSSQNRVFEIEDSYLYAQLSDIAYLGLKEDQGEWGIDLAHDLNSGSDFTRRAYCYGKLRDSGLYIADHCEKACTEIVFT